MIEIVLVKSWHAIAGLLGGLTAYLVDKNMHWRDGVALVVIGGVSSFYLVPAIIQYGGLSGEMASFIAYCVGIISRAVILQVKDKMATMISDKIVNGGK